MRRGYASEAREAAQPHSAADDAQPHLLTVTGFTRSMKVLAQTTPAGGESPIMERRKSRTAFSTVAIFSPWLCSSMGGWAKGAARLAGAPSVSQPSFRSPTPFESGRAVQRPQWSITMTTIIQAHTAPSITRLHLYRIAFCWRA